MACDGFYLLTTIPALATSSDAALLSIGPETTGLVTEPDWGTLGLILAIVGSFLLANAILFRNPRALVREHYGVGRSELRTIREFIFHRLQMTLGFGFLLTGFAVQLVGRMRPVPATSDGRFPILWIGLIVLVAILLEVVGWWWSQRSFRRVLRGYFQENPPDFFTDVHTAREVGELFGLSSAADETVPSYVARLHQAVGLPRPGLAPEAVQAQATRRSMRKAKKAQTDSPDSDSQFDADGHGDPLGLSPRPAFEED